MFKTINEGQMPTRGSKYSAAVDLYASHDCTITAGETKLVGLGVCIDADGLKTVSDRDLENECGKPIDEIIGMVDGDEDIVYFEGFKASHYLQLMLRSSLSKHLVIANGVGIVDLDYPGEIMIRVHNSLTLGSFLDDSCVDMDKSFEIKKGDRIAQVTLLPHKGYLFGIESDEERIGGFGSTDKLT